MRRLILVSPLRLGLTGLILASTVGCIVESDPSGSDDAGSTIDATISEDAASADMSRIADGGEPVEDAGPVGDAEPIVDAAPVVDAERPKDAAVVDAAPVDAAPVDAAPVDAGPMPDAALPDMQVDSIGTIFATAPEVESRGTPVLHSRVAQYSVFPQGVDDGQLLGENPARHDFMALACADDGLFGVVRARTRPGSMALRRIRPQPQVFAPFFDTSLGGRRQSGIGSGLVACAGALWVTTPELLGAPTLQLPRLWTIDPTDGTTDLVEALLPGEDVGDVVCVDDVIYATIKDTNLRTVNLVRLNPRQNIGQYFDATGHGVGGAATYGAAYCGGTFYISTPRLSAHAPGTVNQPSRIMAADLADASTQVVLEDAEADFADMECLAGELYVVRVQHGPGRGSLMRVTPQPAILGPVFTTEDGFFIDGNYASLAVCE